MAESCGGRGGHISRAQCQEKTISAGTTKEDGDAKEGGGHEGERRLPLATGGAGGRQRQEEAALPGDAELRHQEIPPGHGVPEEKDDQLRKDLQEKDYPETRPMTEEANRENLLNKETVEELK
ncbi:hypothetical protein NDU88_004268 [Pleurodeles waltl]|uniref:Uncharacterized protein n=1 Tax=Pleurodeles waltl TaxID=8319 RepID=A0AAV7SIA4_PLEWA|nr:hypothetical protein NDU88_004268 [Pleurodeles waltl]